MAKDHALVTHPIAVKRGQVYSIRPRAHGARKRYIKIFSITHRTTSPRVKSAEVTRSGRLKGRKSDPPITTFLTFNAEQQAWTMPLSYTLETK